MLPHSEGLLKLPVSPQRDEILGPPDAEVTLVEYGDYECPHCGQAHGVLAELMAKKGDFVQLVYRDFPLAEIHPHAERAAEAAHAAGSQGKFWEMHDTLFNNQLALEDENLVAYAQLLGLDVGQFQLDLMNRTYAPRVREDSISGVRSGVNGTPTFFINGVRHDGAWDLESLSSAFENARHAHRHHSHAGHEHPRPHV